LWIASIPRSAGFVKSRVLAVIPGKVYIFVMWRRGYLLLALTCLTCVLVCSAPISAQISRRLDRCLPYPSLADEISDMREGVRGNAASTPGATALGRTVVIDDVKFDGPTRLPDPARERLIAEIKRRSYDAGSRWLDEIQDGSIRDAWQDEGFFKVLPTARAQTVSSDGTVQHVSLAVHIDEGLQYKLGDVRFRSSDPTASLVFSNEELRKVIPVRDGDIFNVQKIREGLNALRRLYGSHGYIDFVVSATTDIDGEHQRILLTLEIDQGKQYRIGKVEVFGPNPQMENLLKSTLKPGEIYKDQVLQSFLKEHKSSLPPDISFEDMEFRRNVTSGTVDLRFNFQTCPQPQQ
jgi:Surface antigen variable number repeat